MPRIRTLKPDFFTSPDVAQVDFPVRIFYQALWCWADDFGIGETNINGLLGFAFPDSDGFTAQDVRRFCADCARHFGTVFYTVRGRHYYAVETWDKHQKLERRTDRRKHPTPDDPHATPDQRIYDCADFAPNMPSRNCAESGKKDAGNRNRGIQDPENGSPTEARHDIDDEKEPSPKCAKHVNDVSPPRCSKCADHRKANDDWKRRQHEAKEAEKKQLRDSIDNCSVCDDRGLIEVANGQARCNHQAVALHG